MEPKVHTWVPPDLMEVLKREDEDLASREEFQSDHVLATPLVEVLSVSIDNNGDGKPIQVYGTIQVVDGEGATFDLYNREESDQETVLSGGSLTLTRPKGRAISPFYQVGVKLDIKDRTKKAVIANGHLTWDYNIKNDYDKVLTEYVDGPCGRAAVRYITHSRAVIATLDVVLVGGSFEGADCVDADVYGKIVAHCGKTCSITLFEKTQDQASRVKYGSYINLYRHVVAVPAYSDLVIAVDLRNRDTLEQICCGNTIIEPLDYSTRYRESIKGQNGFIQVQVEWSHLYSQPPPPRKLTHRFEEASNQEKLDSKKPLPLSSDQLPLLPCRVDRNVSLRSDLMDSSTKLRGDVLLEVFSVVIVSNNGEGFNLWGTIKVNHHYGQTLIYNRDKMCAEQFLSNQNAIIIAPTNSFTGNWLEFKVNLRDADDHKISMGYAGWCERSLESPILWYDRQLCSVIRGEIGYAAIHYSIFSAGVLARVKVCLISSGNSSTNHPQVLLHGSVFTEYSNYKYASPYEKEHYRSKLFQKHPENPQLISSDFKVPLTKSAVGVPLNCFLIVALDLTVIYPQTRAPDSVISIDDLSQAVETLQGRLNFSTHDGMVCSQDQKIKGNHWEIVVSVEWSEVFQIETPKEPEPDVDLSSDVLVLWPESESF